MKINTEIKRIREHIYAFETSVNIDEGKYMLNISKCLKNKSSEQNRYLWELITEIVKEENGGRVNEELKLDLYTKLLEEAGAVSVYCEIQKKDIEKFKKSYRATRIIGFNELNQKIKAIAYIGTSKMDSKEMSIFIDHVLDYANNLGLYSEYWEGLLK